MSTLKPQPRGARRADHLSALLAAGIVLNGLRLRQRLAALRTLPRGAGSGTGAAGEADELVWLTAAGVRVDDATRAAAEAHLLAEGLDVLDLVPGDLPVEQALDLVRRVDPATYRSARLALGSGAYHAIVTPTVGARAGRRGRRRRAVPRGHAPCHRGAQGPRRGDHRPDRGTRPDRAAPTTPPRGTSSSTRSTGVPCPCCRPSRWPTRRCSRGASASGALPAWRRSGSTPSSRGSPSTARRSAPATSVRRAHPVASDGSRGAPGAPWRASTGPPTRPPPARSTPSDPSTRRSSPAASEPFFEPARADCPLCGATDLHELVRVGDLLQGKPGTFRLDECRACRHVFQNPRLSLEGLDFYYRDFYDGLGDPQRRAPVRLHRHLVPGARPHGPGTHRPRRWLDVGAGHGHFSPHRGRRVARHHLRPARHERQRRRGEARRWVSTGYKGLFPDFAPKLAGAYDVVSMHHYLEHTRDPLAELDAAREVLEPGGHLLIEVPNPDSALGRPARVAVGALVPAPAPALRVARQPHRAARRARLHGARHRHRDRAPAHRAGVRVVAPGQPGRTPAAHAVGASAHRRAACRAGGHLRLVRAAHRRGARCSIASWRPCSEGCRACRTPIGCWPGATTGPEPFPPSALLPPTPRGSGDGSTRSAHLSVPRTD